MVCAPPRITSPAKLTHKVGNAKAADIAPLVNLQHQQQAQTADACSRHMQLCLCQASCVSQQSCKLATHAHNRKSISKAVIACRQEASTCTEESSTSGSGKEMAAMLQSKHHQNRVIGLPSRWRDDRGFVKGRLKLGSHWHRACLLGRLGLLLLCTLVVALTLLPGGQAVLGKPGRI